MYQRSYAGQDFNNRNLCERWIKFCKQWHIKIVGQVVLPLGVGANMIENKHKKKNKNQLTQLGDELQHHTITGHCPSNFKGQFVVQDFAIQFALQ